MKFFFVLATSLSLASCATTPQVTSDATPTNVLSHYRSFAWRTKPSNRNVLGQQQIVNDIESQLRAKGWSESIDGEIAIMADVVTSEKQRTSTYDSQGTSRGWGLRAGLDTRESGKVDMNVPPVTSVHTERLSTLTVKMVDSKTQKELWKGAVTIHLTTSQARNSKAVDSGVATLFSRFPSTTRH